jgi:hypothetical protein
MIASFEVEKSHNVTRTRNYSILITLILHAGTTIDMSPASAMQQEMRREISIDEILAFVGARDRIPIKDLHDFFNANYLVIEIIIRFLVRYNFAELDGQCIMLSKWCKTLFEEKTLEKG